MDEPIYNLEQTYEKLSKEELINLLKDAGIIYILSKEQKESKIDTIENECKLVVCAPKGEFVSSMTEDEAKGYTRIIRKAANLNEDDDFYFSCKVKYIGFKLSPRVKFFERDYKKTIFQIYFFTKKFFICVDFSPLQTKCFGMQKTLID